MNIFQLLEYNEFSSVLTVCSGFYLPCEGERELAGCTMHTRKEMNGCGGGGGARARTRSWAPACVRVRVRALASPQVLTAACAVYVFVLNLGYLISLTCRQNIKIALTLRWTLIINNLMDTDSLILSGHFYLILNYFYFAY